MNLEQSTTTEVPPLLQEIVQNILKQCKSSDSHQKDFMFVLIFVLMIESGFLPLNDDCNQIIENLNEIGNQQLKRWKTGAGVYEVPFILSGFEKVAIKMIVSPLGATVLVNMVINKFNSDTYTVCLPISRFVVSPQASTIPMIFRDLKHLSLTFKNKISTPVKSKVYGYYGYSSGSLVGLPQEVIHNIMLNLPIYDVINVNKTCTRLNSLVGQDSLWHKLCTRDFKSVSQSNSSDWKQLYKETFIAERNKTQRQSYRGAGSLHDNMDYSDYVSYIDNPLWDIII